MKNILTTVLMMVLITGTALGGTGSIFIEPGGFSHYQAESSFEVLLGNEVAIFTNANDRIQAVFQLGYFVSRWDNSDAPLVDVDVSGVGAFIINRVDVSQSWHVGFGGGVIHRYYSDRTNGVLKMETGMRLSDKFSVGMSGLVVPIKGASDGFLSFKISVTP